MRSLCVVALAMVVVSASACAGGSPVASGTGSPVGSDTRFSVPSPTPPGAKGGSPSPIPGVPSPLVLCPGKPAGGPMVLVGDAIYDVTDAVHPRLLCQVSNTVTHLYTGDTFAYLRRTGLTGTEVVLHSMGSGNESVIAGWPLAMLDGPFPSAGAWTFDGNEAATAVNATDPSGTSTIQIWLFAQPTTKMLYEFPAPVTDCVCRFGLPQPALAFSADGQYLVSGWPIGSQFPPRVYRVADQSLVATLDISDVTPIWSRNGHRLLLAAARSWTPEDGLSGPASGEWSYMAGLSPDGTQVAYTAYADAVTVRVYVDDLSTNTTRSLVDASRSEVTFVKDGWVWYFEEDPCSGCPGGSQASDKVFAMNLAGGVETPVVFAAGESPLELKSGWSAGQFWPNY